MGWDDLFLERHSRGLHFDTRIPIGIVRFATDRLVEIFTGLVGVNIKGSDWHDVVPFNPSRDSSTPGYLRDSGDSMRFLPARLVHSFLFQR